MIRWSQNAKPNMNDTYFEAVFSQISIFQLLRTKITLAYSWSTGLQIEMCISRHSYAVTVIAVVFVWWNGGLAPHKQTEFHTNNNSVRTISFISFRMKSTLYCFCVTPNGIWGLTKWVCLWQTKTELVWMVVFILEIGYAIDKINKG